MNKMKTLTLLLCITATPCVARAQAPSAFTALHRIQFAPGTEQQRQQLSAIPSAHDLIAEPFEIAREDLNDDGTKEIILMAASSMNCGSGGCLVVVLENHGGTATAIFSQNLYSPLAVTNEKIGSYRALASVDDHGAIIKGDKRGTPMFGKQMVYPMKPREAVPPPPPSSPAQSACAGHPNCAETPTFMAVVPDYRMSNSPYGGRIATVTVRFVNKLNRALVVGYVQNSGVVLDDQGNRYTVQGTDAVRGIGVIDPNRFDPKFSLAPGERSDARFEFTFDAGNKVRGTTYEIDLTVREINAVAGNQYQLGKEYALHFSGFSDAGVVPAAPARPATSGGGAALGPSAASAPSASAPAGVTAPGAAAAPAAAPAAPPADPCGTRPRCYSTGPFMSEVTRMTAATVSAHRIVRVTLQLTNVTNQSVRLGYLANTGALIDDVGNRYSDSQNGVSGIGIVSGGNVDSQFVLGAGESRGATFELFGRPDRLGTVYSYDLTLVQMDILPSKQVRLGREYPVGFKQLAISVPAAAANAPSAASAGPCGAKPRCYSTGPFMSEVTRVSAATVSAHRVVRVTLQLTNLTNQPVILAYVDNTGFLIDNLGNQYMTYNSRSAVSGIGVVAGNSVDTQFVLGAGQSRSASFELSGGGTRAGTAYTYDLTIAQVEILPSQQVRTVGEYAVGFSGLTAGLLDGLKDIIRKEQP